MQVKVLSWNIWVDDYFDKLTEFLDAADADIIGLQEVKDDDPGRDVIGYLAGRGYRHVFARTDQVWDGKEYHHGPAVFSRFPIVKSATCALGDDRAAARADIDANGTILHVFSTHLLHTHQKPSEKQEAETKTLIAKLPQERVIVMGDFNATPESAPIGMMRRVLVDTDPESHPTWCVYPTGCGTCKLSEITVRLDYIFVSQDLKAHSFTVGASKASDHLPVSVMVEVERTGSALHDVS